MGRNTGTNTLSFINGFMGGMSTARSLGGMIDAKKDAEDLEGIANAKPEESTGFTAEQGDELRRLAESGQYDIGYDEAAKAYTVTPKADPTQTGAIAQQGVTDFLGERRAGTMSSSEVENTRQMAMAGVVGRRDPREASRMRREVVQSERDDQRFAMEKTRMERENKRYEKEDAEDAFTKQMEADVGQYMQGRLTGEDGQQRPAKIDDYLAASQYRAAKLMGAGKMDAAEKVIKEHNAQSFMKIQLEGAERDKALGETIAAVNAGNLEAARGFYDRFLPDGANIISFNQDKSGAITAERTSASGQPMAPLVFKDTNHLTASLSALKDPMAVYNYSQNEFRNSLAIKADQRADRAEGRAAASHAVSMANQGRDRSEAAAKAAAGVALFKQNNPGATPVELEAVRQGILSAAPKTGGAYKVEAGDVATLLGTPATDAQGNALVDPLTGRQVVNRNPERERALFKFMRENNITSTDEGLAKFMLQQQGGGAKVPQNVTDADIKATAKKYGISEAEVRKRLGL